MTEPRLHIFGIRHHGPGSARALVRALDAVDPAVVLIEGPPEADELLAFAASPGMRPPLALLVYGIETPAVASFFPLAEFSPEWQAIRWAARRGRETRFIDLPYAIGIAERLAGMAEPEAEVAEGVQADTDLLIRDPLSVMAQAAGYEDGESWWNAVVEQGAHGPGVFAAVEGAMTALRTAAEGSMGVTPDAEREARREAHMRLRMAEALEATEGPVAVVVGAWHTPALRAKAKVSEDRALLRGLDRAKVAATWTPWTDVKLAAASGYGAGVVSPGWYRILWRELERAGVEALDARRLTADWQSRAAEVLRSEGRAVSTAEVIEAARLAETLAALRDRPTPGLAEMRDAGLAVICGGEAAPLHLLEQRLVIGADVGEVDAAVPQTPLQADLSKAQRRLRLKPEALAQEIALDLRSEAGLEKSILLHRLVLIAVPWGRLLDAGRSRGTFRERWALEWAPHLSVALVEAMAWGTTVAGAAVAKATSDAGESTSLARLSELVQACLLADLPDAAETAIARLQAIAVDTSDVGLLLEAAPPLVQVLRYGAARRTPEAALRRIVRGLGEQACVGLHYAARQLDEAAAQLMNTRIGAFDQALSLFEDEALVADWTAALQRVLADAEAAAPVRGGAARRLYDRKVLPPAEAALALSRALSPAVAPSEAAAWLEGFLGGEGEVLLHDPELLAVIDGFLGGLGGEMFQELLPAFRRAFANLDAHQRKRLLDAAKAPADAAAPEPSEVAGAGDEAFAKALPLLKLILGLDP